MAGPGTHVRYQEATPHPIYITRRMTRDERRDPIEKPAEGEATRDPRLISYGTARYNYGSSSYARLHELRTDCSQLTCSEWLAITHQCQAISATPVRIGPTPAAGRRGSPARKEAPPAACSEATSTKAGSTRLPAKSGLGKMRAFSCATRPPPRVSGASGGGSRCAAGPQLSLRPAGDGIRAVSLRAPAAVATS